MRQIIVNRIDKSGVAEPQVVIQGNDRIIVEMPGVQNAEQIRDLVGTTGRLDFVPLGQNQMVQDQEVGQQVLDTKCTDTVTETCVLFSGDQVAAAAIGSSQTGQRTVDFTLTGQGKDLFANYTADHVGDYFAIVLDGKVITAPVIKSSIPNGQVEIESGGDRRLPAGRGPEPRHDPPVRPAAVPDRRSSPTRRSARRWARRSSSRASSPAPSRS